jgi:hypothetical protein
MRLGRALITICLVAGVALLAYNASRITQQHRSAQAHAAVSASLRDDRLISRRGGHDVDSSSFNFPPHESGRPASTTPSRCLAKPVSSAGQRPLELLPLCSDGTAACSITRRAAEHSVLVLSGAAGERSEALRARLIGARAAVDPTQLVLVALDGAARQLAADLGVAWWAAEAVPQSEAGREAGADPTGPSAQWRAAAALLRAGCAVVVGGPHVLWLGSPFSSVGRDVDHLPNMAGTSGWSS